VGGQDRPVGEEHGVADDRVQLADVDPLAAGVDRADRPVRRVGRDLLEPAVPGGLAGHPPGAPGQPLAEDWGPQFADDGRAARAADGGPAAGVALGPGDPHEHPGPLVHVRLVGERQDRLQVGRVFLGRDEHLGPRVI
jgi:hypothetical protein